MKVALIISGNVSSAPYVYYYTKILKHFNISFDIISWDRLNLGETDTIAYCLKLDVFGNYYHKLVGYYRYCKFVQFQLQQKQYDKVIVFTIVLGILLYPFCLRKYDKKYIFDIRDYSIAAKICGRKFRRMIERSAITVISSPGFKTWLPLGRNYVIGHNCRLSEKSLVNDSKQVVDGIAHILTIGALRDYDANSWLLKELGNNERYTLEFVGAGVAEPMLRKFVSINQIQNVVFRGRYDKADEIQYFKKATLVNILTNNDLNSSTLMSNRFYLSIQMQIPVIVSKHTQQGACVEKYKLGIVVDENLNLQNQLEVFLRTYDRQVFKQGCLDFLSLVQKEQELFADKVTEFLFN